MNDWIPVIIAVISSIMASSGFWTLLLRKEERRSNKEDLSSKLLLGLGHYRITALGKEYIDRGWITPEEYENLNDYLFKPYKSMGGNGTAEKIMMEINKLPLSPPESEEI